MTERVRKLNDREPREGTRYVLYWSQMNRRVESNHALAFAAGLANQEGMPLLFYEGLTCTYPFASDRFHTFLLEEYRKQRGDWQSSGSAMCFI